MLYILASNYNKKLHKHIVSIGIQAQYITSVEQLLLKDTDTVIVDVICLDAELTSFLKDVTFRSIYMSDENRTSGNMIYISKYQPIESICSAIFDLHNQLIVIIGDEALFIKIMLEHPNCNSIDFSYNPDSDSSLIQILDKCEADFFKFFVNSNNKIVYPITTIMDLLDPPIKLIKPMVDAFKKSRDTIVRIDQLKGPLDLMLLSLSDLIIIVHVKIEASNKEFDISIKKIFNPKKIISLTVSTKAYEQFQLSSHMLCDKEA